MKSLLGVSAVVVRSGEHLVELRRCILGRVLLQSRCALPKRVFELLGAERAVELLQFSRPEIVGLGLGGRCGSRNRGWGRWWRQRLKRVVDELDPRSIAHLLGIALLLPRRKESRR